MKITELAKRISKLEGGKINLGIAQISEVLNKMNKIFNGRVYDEIRGGFKKKRISLSSPQMKGKKQPKS